MLPNNQSQALACEDVLWNSCLEHERSVPSLRRTAPEFERGHC